MWLNMASLMSHALWDKSCNLFNNMINRLHFINKKRFSRNIESNEWWLINNKWWLAMINNTFMFYKMVELTDQI